MSETYRIIALVIFFSYLLFCWWVGARKKFSTENTKDYFLAGKNIGPLFLFFTCFASISGAGNFIGLAGRGADIGLSAYWWWLGEIALGYVLFGLVLAPYLARFDYITMPQYISDYLAGGDTVVRRVAGIASLLPNVAWAGGQMMGLAYLLQVLLGLDYRIAILLTSVVMIYYTVQGGLAAVIYTDFVQGIAQLALVIGVLIFGLRVMNFDFGWLKSSVMAQDTQLWNPLGIGTKSAISHVLIGFCGALSNSVLWSRSFAAKDVNTAKKAFGISMTASAVFTFFVVAFGITANVFNPGVGDQATMWLVINKMPGFMALLMTLGITGATMSTADTHLNCGAANIMVDILDPEGKLPDEKAVKYSKISTIVVGIIAIAGALYFPTVMDYAEVGYTISGGVLIPIFLIGLYCRDRESEQFKSKLSISAVKFGIIVGIIFTVAFELVPSLNSILSGGIIPGLITTTIATLLANSIVRSKETAQ